MLTWYDVYRLKNLFCYHMYNLCTSICRRYNAGRRWKTTREREWGRAPLTPMLGTQVLRRQTCTLMYINMYTDVHSSGPFQIGSRHGVRCRPSEGPRGDALAAFLLRPAYSLNSHPLVAVVVRLLIRYLCRTHGEARFSYP